MCLINLSLNSVQKKNDVEHKRQIEDPIIEWKKMRPRSKIFTADFTIEDISTLNNDMYIYDQNYTQKSLNNVKYKNNYVYYPSYVTINDTKTSNPNNITPNLSLQAQHLTPKDRNGSRLIH